jgi:cobaltochelatase CobT
MQGSINLLLICLVIGSIIWILFVRRPALHTAAQAVDDSNQTYSVFTSEFDIETRGDGAARTCETMETSKHFFSRKMIETSWPERIRLAQQDVEHHVDWDIPDSLGTKAQEITICLLVDLSGSMANAIIPLASALQRCCERFESADIPVALLGFTTVGWKGGRSRQKWLEQGAPERPGRLCDLLHLTFKSFDESLPENDWKALLHPAILCENIDGEALEWAARLLSGRKETNKFLIVISDGAPVDDSTLSANGPGFLERHIRSVIARLEQDRAIHLGAVGIGYAVENYYSQSILAQTPGDFLSKFTDLLHAMLEKSN